MMPSKFEETYTRGKNLLSVDSLDKAPSHDIHTHDRNTERAYIAASRREDRSLEARVKSARMASDIHKAITGKALYITEDIVKHGHMYEEIDERVPASQLLGDSFVGASHKAGGKPEHHINGSMSTALFLLEMDRIWRDDKINRLFKKSFPDADDQARSLWNLQKQHLEGGGVSTKRSNSQAVSSGSSSPGREGLQRQKRRKSSGTKERTRRRSTQSPGLQNAALSMSTEAPQPQSYQFLSDASFASPYQQQQQQHQQFGVAQYDLDLAFPASTMPLTSEDASCEGMKGSSFLSDGMSAQGWMDLLDYNNDNVIV